MFGFSCSSTAVFSTSGSKTTHQTVNHHATPRRSKIFNSIKIKYSSFNFDACLHYPNICQNALVGLRSINLLHSPELRQIPIVSWKIYRLCIRQLNILTKTKQDFICRVLARAKTGSHADRGWSKKNKTKSFPVTIFTFWVFRSHILTRSSHVLPHSGPF